MPYGWLQKKPQGFSQFDLSYGRHFVTLYHKIIQTQLKYIKIVEFVIFIEYC